VTSLGCNLQGAGFAADSVRTIQAVRRESPNVQILLFSATFDDTVKRFAMKVVPGANQVKGALLSWHSHVFGSTPRCRS
jgi:superfamily II DNA/RNA helicase